MSAAPPARRTREPLPEPVDAGLLFSVGVARYRSDSELANYLRASRAVTRGRLVVVLGLSRGDHQPIADHSPETRLILTSDALFAGRDPVRGWYEPNPTRAVVTAMAGLEAGDALLLLFPTDWLGDAPEELLDRARRWRAGMHSPLDDLYFRAD